MTGEQSSEAKVGHIGKAMETRPSRALNVMQKNLVGGELLYLRFFLICLFSRECSEST